MIDVQKVSNNFFQISQHILKVTDESVKNLKKSSLLRNYEKEVSRRMTK